MKRSKVKLQLSYDGTDFKGWQKQSSTPHTVQEALETALSKIFNEPIKVCSAGRTDAGVHALNQYAHFWTTKNPENYNLTYALNGRLLPESIVVKKVWLAPDNFHALSSIKKTYKYYVLCRSYPSALRRNFVHYIHRSLDLKYLNQASALLLGEHDFSSFQTTGTDSKTTIKNVFSIGWEPSPGDLVVFSITGDGFLRQMVRNIVGTLLWMERQQIPIDHLLSILEKRDRQAARDTAPAKGLYLYDVEYSRELDIKCRQI